MHDLIHGKKRAIVLGLGRFGGGLGVTRALATRGLPVLVIDRLDECALVEPIVALSDLGQQGLVQIVTGDDTLPKCGADDLVIVNPAVPRPWAHAGLQQAESGGACITTEIELTVRAIYKRLGPDADVIAITGSSGKSTTTSMIGEGLRAAGRAVLVGGNIGGSLLEQVATAPPDAAVVLEMSSAMLWWLERCEVFIPRVGVLTTYGENHLDWHGEADHYRRCKQLLLARTRTVAILGEGVADWAVPGGVQRIIARTGDVEPGVLSVPGRHNRLNAAMAIEACVAVGADRTVAMRGIAAFTGLEHRLCRIGSAGGVVFFDDSKSTTPEATLLAVQSLREAGFDTIHLIAGGYDKGSDLNAIRTLGDSLATLATIGTTGETLAGTHGISCKTLDRAMREIKQRIETQPTASQHAVLLSPGCASWDQFTNFVERGQRFAALAAEVYGCV